MSKQLISHALGLCVSFVVLFGASAAFSETFPDRAIKIIVPYPATGTSDYLARLIAPKLA